jgi:ABC-type uncharacterized transport system permease subunit
MNRLLLRVLLAACLLSFLLCHLSWGKGQGGYFWELELEILAGGLRKDLLHPALLLPFLGQLLLLWSLIAPTIRKRTAFAGIALCGVLVLFLLLIKLLGRETKGIVAAELYIFCSLWILIRSKYFWPRPSASSGNLS